MLGDKPYIGSNSATTMYFENDKNLNCKLKRLLLPKIDRKMSFHAERVEKVYEIDKINIVYNEKLNIVEIHSSFSNV